MKKIIQKKAFFDYEILEKLEAGIELKGHEVKSIKEGKVSLANSFVIIRKNEAWLMGANIPPYQLQNIPKNYDPLRKRKLLLKKKEIETLLGKTRKKGLTIVPLKLYQKKGKIKIEIGLAKSKKKYQKKEKIKKREIEREIEREMKKIRP